METVLVRKCISKVIKNIGFFESDDFQDLPFHVVQKVIKEITLQQKMRFTTLTKIQFLDGIIELDLSMTGRLNREWLRIIRTMGLRKLNLSHCFVTLAPFLPNKQLRKKRKNFEISKSLLSLNLSHTHSTSRTPSVKLRNIHIMFPRLQVLSLETSHVSSNDLKPLQHLKDLIYLNIKNNQIRCDRTLDHVLSYMKNLEVLNAGNLPLIIFKSVLPNKRSWMNKLTYLNLNFCDQVNDQIFRKFFFSGTNHRKDLITYESLRTLNISRTKISDLSLLRIFPNLCSLDISRNPFITMKSMFVKNSESTNEEGEQTKIIKFPKLQSLCVMECPNLESHGLETLLFPNNSGSNIRELNQLCEETKSKGMSLYSLDISRMKVTNRILEYISKNYNSTLERLTMNSCNEKLKNGSSLDFSYLKTLERLMELSMQFTCVTIDNSSSSNDVRENEEDDDDEEEEVEGEEEEREVNQVVTSFIRFDFFVNHLRNLRRLDLAGVTLKIRMNCLEIQQQQQQQPKEGTDEVERIIELRLDLTNLEFLNISHMKVVARKPVKSLENEEYELSSTGTTLEEEECYFYYFQLSKCTNLRTICMTGPNKFFKFRTLSSLKSSMTQLDTCIIKRCFTSSNLQLIDLMMRRLTVLDLEGSTCLKSQDLVRLPKSLLELNLRNCKNLGDFALKAIAERLESSLIRLNVLGIFFTDVGVFHASKLRNLCVLKISVSEMMNSMEDLKHALRNLVYLVTKEY